MNFLHLFQYINFGGAVAITIQGFFSLVSAKQPVTGPQVYAVCQPAIIGLQGAFPNVHLPDQLISDLCQAAATAMDKYVFKAPALAPAPVPALTPLPVKP